MEESRGDRGKIKVLTLNCWGIPYVSSDVKKRFTYIAKELASGKYDIVSLQEVWSQTDYEYVAKKVTEVLPYAVYFHSGVIGSGVCVFSKYPITDTFNYRYSLSGYMYMIHHGDWFGGKSASYCLIDHPMHPIYLFTTHLHAEYNRQNDSYLGHRTVQAFQLSEFINYLTKPSDCVIVCGDMNTEPTDTCYRVIKHLPDLTDTWDVAGQKGDFHGNTCDLSTNSYTTIKLDKELRGGSKDGKRIDYVFYRAPPGTIRCVEHMVTMGKIPGEDLSYSDHEGVLATFIVDDDTSSIDSSAVDGDEKESLKKKCEEVLQEIMNVTQHEIDSISNARLTTCLLIFLLAVFIFSPLVYSAGFSSAFHILRPLGKMVYVLRFLSTVFLTGVLFYVIFNSRDELKAYQNVQHEVKLQMKYKK
ncbi:putative neutral sphingomyelinase [Actinia tenebrosa]|uniref:sphingomyelin phosphodiesterase n=1 Tax=Actinia tenebrosa TaxID=6105 RepID=A0A6P8J547_ACTTE|nr:putative neutral sphingomyelinase [Actinia tenebrosa]